MRAGGQRRSRDCDRRTLTIRELHAELQELVDSGVLEVVTGPDGIERYQRPDDGR